MHTLRIRILSGSDKLKEYYQNLVTKYSGDCGIDLMCPEFITVPCNTVKKIHFGIACEMVSTEEYKPEPFMLVPRSSISNTSFSMANSVGIIDAGYRGEIIAAVRCHPNENNTVRIDEIHKGSRLFQIVAFDGKPIQVIVVDKLSSTDRGDKGFGSTGK